MARLDETRSGAFLLDLYAIAPGRGTSPDPRFGTPSSLGSSSLGPTSASARDVSSDQAGLIALDEHTSIGCLIHDITAQGVELTVPDASIVPDVFMLTASSPESIKVCHTLWRSDETIRARFR